MKKKKGHKGGYIKTTIGKPYFTLTCFCKLRQWDHKVLWAKKKAQPNDSLKPFGPKICLDPLQSNNASKCKSPLTCTAPLGPYL